MVTVTGFYLQLLCWVGCRGRGCGNKGTPEHSQATDQLNGTAEHCPCGSHEPADKLGAQRAAATGRGAREGWETWLLESPHAQPGQARRKGWGEGGPVGQGCQRRRQKEGRL